MSIIRKMFEEYSGTYVDQKRSWQRLQKTIRPESPTIFADDVPSCLLDVNGRASIHGRSPVSWMLADMLSPSLRRIPRQFEKDRQWETHFDRVIELFLEMKPDGNGKRFEASSTKAESVDLFEQIAMMSTMSVEAKIDTNRSMANQGTAAAFSSFYTHKQHTKDSPWYFTYTVPYVSYGDEISTSPDPIRAALSFSLARGDRWREPDAPNPDTDLFTVFVPFVGAFSITRGRHAEVLLPGAKVVFWDVIHRIMPIFSVTADKFILIDPHSGSQQKKKHYPFKKWRETNFISEYKAERSEADEFSMR